MYVLKLPGSEIKLLSVNRHKNLMLSLCIYITIRVCLSDSQENVYSIAQWQGIGLQVNRLSK